MDLEELINKTNDELAREEQKATKTVIEKVYEKLKTNMKNDADNVPVDISVLVNLNCSRKNYIKVLNNVTNFFRNSGYYIKNNYVYLSYDLYKKDKKIDRIFSLVFLVFALVVVFCIMYCFSPILKFVA